LLVWQDSDGRLGGFAAGDARNGTIWALLVMPGDEGRGIGRALLRATCETLRQAGHKTAALRLEVGTRAERHYRADGWTGTAEKGVLVLTKVL
jgi:GNAT superfamily N-acetyltransferase